MKTTTSAGRAWHFSHSIGRPTSEHNQHMDGTMVGGFLYPVAIAVAPDGMAFVLNRGMGFPYIRPVDTFMRIGKLTIDKEHTHIGDFARAGFVWPAGIAVSKDGNVYCSDEYENTISFFDPDRMVPYPEFNDDGDRLGRWGETGLNEGQLNGPNGLAFDNDDNLYVVDSRNDRVQKFTKGGRFLLGWGISGSGEGQFDRPWGITIDHNGDVYVVDWSNNRVQKFSAEGEFLMSFGSQLGDGGSLNHPADVAVDNDGDVYVTDWGNRRVQIYSPDGDMLATLYGDAIKSSKAGEYALSRNQEAFDRAYDRIDDLTRVGRFRRPTAIAVGQDNKIVISDNPGRLQVYIKDNNYLEPALNVEIDF